MDVTGGLPAVARSLGLDRHRTLAFAGLTGVLTGVAVAGFDGVTNGLIYDRVREAPLAAQVLLPTLGLAVAALALSWLGHGATPATSDAYIKNFHERGRRLDLRPFWGRLVAGVATLGTGGAMGFEGPSMYIGASVGAALQRRWPRYFSRADSKVLLVAGAAAGVAAIFKAPATGAIFALEVPYRDDTARRMLLPALIAAATGYLTFVALLGTEPLFAVAGSPPFDFKELGGAVLLGLVCGAGARLYAAVLTRAKQWATRTNPVVRVSVAGASLAVLAFGSNRLFDQPLALGSGYASLAWVTQGSHALTLIVALFGFRLAATACTVGGGGVGGLFVPLVVAGAIVGNATASIVHDTSTLFPLIGVAAFLAAGYRTPLAGVMFVAETTGRPGFIVPGLIAAVASQLVMGDVSLSPYQVAGRVGHLERRFQLTIGAALDADVATVPSDTTLAEFYDHQLLVNRRIEVPVVDGATYRGMVSVYGLQSIPMADWGAHVMSEILDAERPTVGPLALLEDAIRIMERADVDQLAVLDGPTFIGVVTTAGIIGLGHILDETVDDAP